MSTPLVGSSRMQTEGSPCEPAAEDRLLLVAARERDHRRLEARMVDAERRGDVRGEPPLAAQRQQRQAARRGARRGRARSGSRATGGRGRPGRGGGPRTPAPARGPRPRAGCGRRTAGPPSVTSPVPRRSPSSSSAISLRPAPTRPARPRISPARKVEADIRAPGCRRPGRGPRGPPARPWPRAGGLAAGSPRSRPTISRARLAAGSRPACRRRPRRRRAARRSDRPARTPPP